MRLWRTLIDVRLGRGGNNREHPLATHRRAKQEQELAAWAMVRAVGRSERPVPPLRITMTRCSPAQVQMDDDNLAGSLKHIRDGIAKYLGVNDNDTRVEWVPEQRKDPWGCEITVEEVRDGDEEEAA